MVVKVQWYKVDSVQYAGVFLVAEWLRFSNTLQKIEYAYNIIKISYKTKSSVLNTMVMLKMSRNGFLMEIFDFQYGTCSVRICVLSLMSMPHLLS